MFTTSSRNWNISLTGSHFFEILATSWRIRPPQRLECQKSLYHILLLIPVQFGKFTKILVGVETLYRNGLIDEHLIILKTIALVF